MAGAKVAETPQEFIAKYKSKKFRADTAGLCVILEYLYRCYRLQETAPENLPEHLYPPERYEAIVTKGATSEKERDRWLINGMQNLMEWIPTVNDAALTAREAAIMAISNAVSSLNTFAFMLNRTICYFDRTDPETVSGQVNKADLMHDLLEYEFDFRKQYENAREYIENNLCYIHAYNTFFGIVSDELAIPEARFFLIDKEPIEESLNHLNEALQKQYAALLSVDEECGDITNFSPVNMIPEEIPEENLRRSTGSIVWAIYHGGAWSNAFLDILEGYWRRRMGNG